MGKIDEIKRYIELTEIPRSTRVRYDLSGDEFKALAQHTDQGFDVLYLAYTFGRARGYRAGKVVALKKGECDG